MNTKINLGASEPVLSCKIKSVSSDDADIFIRESMGESVTAVPCDEQGFFGKSETLRYGELTVSFVRTRGAYSIFRPAASDRMLLMFSQPGAPSFQLNGRLCNESSIAIIGAGGMLGMTLPSPANFVFVEIPMQSWEAASAHSANPSLLAPLSHGYEVLQAPGGLSQLASVLHQARRAVATRATHANTSDALARSRQIVATAVKTVSARSNTPARSVASRHLVDCYTRAVRCITSHMPAGIGVSALCEETGVHERTLQMAFRTLSDMTPGQYIRFLRLAYCRRRLTRSFPDEDTVSGIAMEYGFMYPSQFAAYYRKVFGETPSVTLRRNPGQLPTKIREREIVYPDDGRASAVGYAARG